MAGRNQVRLVVVLVRSTWRTRIVGKVGDTVTVAGMHAVTVDRHRMGAWDGSPPGPTPRGEWGTEKRTVVVAIFAIFGWYPISIWSHPGLESTRSLLFGIVFAQFRFLEERLELGDSCFQFADALGRGLSIVGAASEVPEEPQDEDDGDGEDDEDEEDDEQFHRPGDLEGKQLHIYQFGRPIYQAKPRR